MKEALNFLINETKENVECWKKDLEQQEQFLKKDNTKLNYLDTIEKHLVKNDNEIKEYVHNRRKRFNVIKKHNEEKIEEAKKSLEYFSHALLELENKLKSLK